MIAAVVAGSSRPDSGERQPGKRGRRLGCPAVGQAGGVDLEQALWGLPQSHGDALGHLDLDGVRPRPADLHRRDPLDGGDALGDADRVDRDERAARRHGRGVAYGLLRHRDQPRDRDVLDVGEMGVVEQHPGAEADDDEQHDGADQRRGQPAPPVPGRQRRAGRTTRGSALRPTPSRSAGRRDRSGRDGLVAQHAVVVARPDGRGVAPSTGVVRRALPRGPAATRPVPVGGRPCGAVATSAAPTRSGRTARRSGHDRDRSGSGSPARSNSRSTSEPSTVTSPAPIVSTRSPGRARPARTAGTSAHRGT